MVAGCGDCEYYESIIASADKERDAFSLRIKILEEALRGVITVADRKTVEFDRAKDALEKSKEIGKGVRK